LVSKYHNFIVIYNAEDFHDSRYADISICFLDTATQITGYYSLAKLSKMIRCFHMPQPPLSHADYLYVSAY